MPNEATADEIERANELEREQQAARVQQAAAAVPEPPTQSKGEATDPVGSAIKRFPLFNMINHPFPVLGWLIIFIAKLGSLIAVIGGMLSIPVSWALVAWASFISSGGGKAKGLPLNLPVAKGGELAAASFFAVLILLLPIVIILVIMCNMPVGKIAAVGIKIGAALGNEQAKAANELLLICG